MNKLNINENIFDLLLNDYNTYKSNKDYQNQFQVGIDFFEAVIKFFGILNISVIKSIDEEIYKQIIANNFKEKPSLGDFKSLASQPFTKIAKNINKNEFYKFIEKIFKKEKIDLTLDTILSIKGEEDKQIKISTMFDLFEKYLVTFRNQLKGHSASFRAIDENEKEFVHKVINSLDLIVTTLNEKLNKVLENITFYEKEHKLFAKYQDIQIELLPIMIYLACDKYSCCIDNECKEKRIRIFFFNDIHNEKIYFLDYGYNHFYNIKDLENIYQETQNFFDNLKQYKKEINFVEYISDKGKHDNVLENFVGRKEELKSLKSHIQSNLSNATFSYIIGKPGIGKSALMAKLLEELKDETKSLKPFIFYARNSNMGGGSNEEIETLYSKIESFIRDVLNDKQLKIESESMNDKFDKLFLHYETHSNSPILLIIDGLDEFKDWQKVVDTIPLNFSKNIHIICTSRDYNDMVSHIESKITDYNSSIEILKHNSNYCLEIGKLSDNEVEELINIALPKELKQRKDYKEIIQIIIQKSESLPLYLDYLISMLKDTNIKLDEFEKWSKTLPEGIDEFYETSFKKASSEAMRILILLYFSLPNNYKRDLKVIFTDLEITKNIKEFENIFNEIEIFLYEIDNKYSFYHQSVKDAIEIYLDNHSELKILDNNKLSEILYFNSNQKYIYLDKKSETFKFLEKVIENLKTNQDLPFYIQNFFHLYYQYIHFKLYQSILSFYDVINKNYSHILQNTQINDEIKNLISDFLERFDTKQNKQLFEIRYAYNLAFLIQDYKKVLKYMDEYQEFIYDEFLEIALNIDKIEYIQKFISLKDDWINNIPKEMKDFYIQIMAKKETLPDEFVKVIEFLDDEYKIKLVVKLDIQLALEVVRNIDNKREKSRILVYIAKKLADKELYKEAKNVIESINDENEKSESLSYISKTLADKELYKEAIEVVKDIDDEDKKLEALSYISKKLADKELYKEAIEVAKDIDDEMEKSEALAYIAEILADKELYKEAIKVAKDIDDEMEKSEALSYISKKLADKELYKEAIEVAKDIDDEMEKSKILAYITEKTGDKDLYKKVIEIVRYIDNKRQKLQIFMYIAKKTDDKELYNKEALKIVRYIDNKRQKSEILVYIIEKSNDKELYKEAIEIAKDIDDELEKSDILSYIAEILADKELYKEALKTAKYINDKRQKSEILSYISKKLADKKLYKEAIEITKDIDDAWKKSEILSYISKILVDKELYKEAIEIAKDIDNAWKKSEILVYIIEKSNYKELYKEAIEIVKDIDDEDKKSEILVYIIEKSNYKELYKEAIEVAKDIDDEWKKSEILSYISKKLVDKELYKEALEVAKDIDNKMQKSEILVYIAEKSDDKELYKKALKIVKDINNKMQKSEILVYIAEKSDDKELYKKAIEVVRSINDKRQKSEILSYISKKLADKELYKEAIEVAKDIDDEWIKSGILAYIAEILADKELYKEAIEVAKDIDDEWKKSGILAYIAEILADKELYKEAIEVAKDIDDEMEKLASLLYIAEKTNDKELYKEAIEIVKDIDDEWKKSEALVYIAEKTNNKELYKEAIEVAKDIDDEMEKSEALAYIAEILADKELYKEALKTAKYINDKRQKSEILSYISKKLADKELYEQAIEVAENIDDEWGIKSKTLAYIAEKSDDKELYKEAIKVAKDINDEMEKSEVLSYISKKLADKELYKEAIEVAKDIDDEMEKSEALAYIAEKSDDKELYKEAIKVAKDIDDAWKKSEILSYISKILVDKELYKEAIEIAKDIDDEWKKSEALVYIAEKTDDKKYLLDGIEIIFQINDKKRKIELFNKIQKIDKEQNLNKYIPIIKNPISHEYIITSFDVSDTLDLVSEISADDVLEYFDVIKEISKLDTIIEDTKQKITNSSDKKAQRNIIKELKNEILSDENLTNEFIEKYGDEFDIESEDDFDELTLGNFKEVFIKE